MTVKYPEIEVQLTGNDGNAFSIIAAVQKELRRHPEAKDEISEFQKEAMSGDYDHLLQTCMKWVTVL